MPYVSTVVRRLEDSAELGRLAESPVLPVPGTADGGRARVEVDQHENASMNNKKERKNYE